MIRVTENTFILTTEDTEYVFEKTKFGHLENIYYGEKLDDSNFDFHRVKRTVNLGNCVMYDESDDLYCLDVIPLEYSGSGKGDFRHPPAEIKMPSGGYTCDFTFDSYEIIPGDIKDLSLPCAYGDESECETLLVHLSDKTENVGLDMYYTVFSSVNVIARRVVLINKNENPLYIRKLMSLMIDLSGSYSLLTLDGSWLNEANRHVRKVEKGVYVNESLTGASSNRHNPGIMLFEDSAGEDHGNVYGFNLIYSGNHYEAVELSFTGLTRVMSGINPHCFEWKLSENESFATPQAVMTFSSCGFNKASHNFHDFVNSHIVRGEWKNKPRPVAINDWESYFFKFTRAKLLRLAKRAKKLGAEMFVLDDGWFGDRESSKAGLGDYHVNKKKLPRGLKELSEKIRSMGMTFGLWFEPEMVNIDSELYRAHPEYAVMMNNRKASFGRDQLVLDLCRKDVRDYIVEKMTAVLDEANIGYVKWDCNRHMSDMFSSAIENQGEFYHRYMLGLYDVFTRIFRGRENILVESCSSGGNRFDLGMLCFSQQVWASDDTDPVERLKIQKGLSYFYPASTISAHVSESPHMQTLRPSPLTTRTDVAAFGVFGLEIDLKYLSRLERKELMERIEKYKAYRDVFQYGKLYRFDNDEGYQNELMCVAKDGSKAACALFQNLAVAAPPLDILRLKGLNKSFSYKVRSLPKVLPVRRFGGLINFFLPFKLSPDNFLVRLADRFVHFNDAVETYTASGAALMSGIRLNNQFSGSGYNADVRMMGDFASAMYLIEKV